MIESISEIKDKPQRRRPDVGQTTIDFVIGIFAFLLTITFVLSQTSTLLTPYEDQTSPVVADRVANKLADQLLTPQSRNVGATPGTLSEPCVVAFFKGSSDEGCPFDATEPLRDRLGISARYSANVSVVRNKPDGEFEAVCYDGENVVDCGSNPLKIGPIVPTSDKSVSTVYRGVIVDDEPATLVIRVWTR